MLCCREAISLVVNFWVSKNLLLVCQYEEAVDEALASMMD